MGLFKGSCCLPRQLNSFARILSLPTLPPKPAHLKHMAHNSHEAAVLKYESKNQFMDFKEPQIFLIWSKQNVYFSGKVSKLIVAVLGSKFPEAGKLSYLCVPKLDTVLGKNKVLLNPAGIRRAPNPTPFNLFRPSPSNGLLILSPHYLFLWFYAQFKATCSHSAINPRHTLHPIFEISSFS